MQRKIPVSIRKPISHGIRRTLPTSLEDRIRRLERRIEDLEENSNTRSAVKSGPETQEERLQRYRREKPHLHPGRNQTQRGGNPGPEDT